MVRTALAAVNALGGRRVLVWGALCAAFALALDFVPLFDLLGYDFCFAIGLMAAFAASDIGAGTVAAARRTDDSASGNAASVGALVGRAIALSGATLVLPLTFSLANAVRVRNCNLAAGLAFFVLLPVATAAFAATSGALAAVMTPRRGRLLALALPVLSIAWTLGRLYFDPPVFAYDPFGGYFPGPIYDEALRPSTTLWLYRGANLVWAAAAVAVAAIVLRRGPGATFVLEKNVRAWGWRRVVLATVLVGASIALFAARGRLGFHTQRSDLARVLDGERRTPRLVLRYATGAGLTNADLDLTMEDLAFRYDQLRETFGIEPTLPITVYQFASTDQKKALVGAGQTLYAKPWTREIFVQAESFPARRLRHEMAHVFAGAFGDRLFGVAFAFRWWGPVPIPRLAGGLIEGVAEAADFTDPSGGSTTHQEAAAIVADGRAPPLDAVVGAGFSTISGPRAYTLAGSFCRYLLETRGPERLRAVYQSAGDFRGVYGRSLAELEPEWKAFLGQQKLSAEQRARAREEFRRPAIFKKVCAREQAARLAASRAIVATQPRQAAALLERACADDPQEPTLRIALAEAKAAAGDASGALGLLSGLEQSGDTTAPIRARAASTAATLHFQAGDVAATRDALRRVLAAATTDSERRLAIAKLRSLADDGAKTTLGRALFGDSPAVPLDAVVTFYLISEFARLNPDEALGPYLMGRQLADRDPKLALRHLRTACEPPEPATPLPPDFHRECGRLMSLAAYRAGDLPRSHAATEALGREAEDEAEKLRAADFLARITWKAARTE